MERIPRIHRSATDQFSGLVAQLSEDHLTRPTPCTEWDVRALVAHLVEENLWVPPLMAGETIESVGDRFAGDVVGDDPAGAWQASVGPACAALEESGAMERTVHLSFGDVPGSEYAKQLTVDLVVHAWDLARGAGLAETLDPEGVEACLEWAEPWKPMLAQASEHFDPPIEPGSGADPQTRLLNLFGRRP